MTPTLLSATRADHPSHKPVQCWQLWRPWRGRISRGIAVELMAWRCQKGSQQPFAGESHSFIWCCTKHISLLVSFSWGYKRLRRSPLNPSWEVYCISNKQALLKPTSCAAKVKRKMELFRKDHKVSHSLNLEKICFLHKVKGMCNIPKHLLAMLCSCV